MKPVGLVAFDLDGTVGTSQGVPEQNRNMLRELGQMPVVRVAATGRSLHSFFHSPYASLDVDYVVFSSGLGVFDARLRQVTASQGLGQKQIEHITGVLLSRQVDFSLHLPVPDNHLFFVYRAGQDNPDLDTRCASNPGCLAWPEHLPQSASQFLVILPPNAAYLYGQLQEAFSAFSVIRATSPLDGQSLWLEIFPPTICKSRAVADLAGRYGFKPEQVLAVGNDYNDLDLLRWAGRGLVVADSPPRLLQEFDHVGACADGGCAQAILRWLEEQKRSI